jgi:hypothetical protein
MTISSNLTFFNNKSIEDFNPEKGIESIQTAYRFRVEYDEKTTVSDKLNEFCKNPKIAEVEELVIGSWGYDGEGSGEVVETLVANKEALKNLKALMLGDITYEENEISWIEQSDLTPILENFPDLLVLQARGGNGLRISKCKHDKLQKLIIESGGLGQQTIEDVLQAELPNLEHLELWLGSSDYGFESSMEDIKPLLSKGKFPRLKYLGLKNSELADDIAEALKDSNILDGLEVLDLSLGTMSDRGAEALCENPQLAQLKFLDLHRHYISASWIYKLDALGIKVDLSEAEEADEEDRYVSVGE